MVGKLSKIITIENFAYRTGEQGMIFRELVEDLDPSIDPNTVFSWFHPNCTKSEAVDMLVKAGPGSFLVRPSDNSPGDYSLFFHINNQIQRFRIEKKGVRYLMGGRTFECLDAVINRYRKEQIVEGHTLGQPVREFLIFINMQLLLIMIFLIMIFIPPSSNECSGFEGLW